MGYTKNVFLTGATSPLGIHILRLLLLDKNAKIFLLMRGINSNVALGRIRVLLRKIQDGDKNNYKLTKSTKIILGDITKDKCGVNKKAYRLLCNSLTEIYHCAALTNFNESLKNVRKVNVEGTRNLLELARNCRHLKKVNYISSVFISGSFKGSFNENNLNVGQRFNNPYEQSKFEAELLIRNSTVDGVVFLIFRPSVITGEFNGPMTHTHGLFCQFLRILAFDIFDMLPISKQTMINFVPCDAAAMAIYILGKFCDQSATYHITSQDAFSLRSLAEFASKYLGCNNPKYIERNDFSLSRLTVVQRKILAPFLPYFYLRVTLSSEKTFERLAGHGFKFPKITERYIMKLIRHGRDVGYFKS